MTLKYLHDYGAYLERLIDESVEYLHNAENFNSDFEPEFNPQDVIRFIGHVMYEKDSARKAIASASDPVIESGQSIIYESIELALRNLIKFDPYESGEGHAEILAEIHRIQELRINALNKEMQMMYGVDIPFYHYFEMGDTFEDSIRKFLM